jgi:hypothetical protein
VQWLQRKSLLSTTGLPRYMDAVYNERVDLQKTMPEVRMGELSAFAWWAHRFGRFEVPSFRLFGHKVSIRRSITPGGRVSGGVDTVGFFNAEHGIGEAARLLVEAIRTTDIPVSNDIVNMRSPVSSHASCRPLSHQVLSWRRGCAPCI